MKINKTGLRLCPVCGGALRPSGKTDLRACRTCASCSACGLIDTPDGAGCEECALCGFALSVAVPWGFDEDEKTEARR